MKSEKYYNTIIRPVITEKSLEQANHQQVIFIVKRDANKEDIKHAIEYIYKNAQVLAVNIMNVKGKVKRFRNILGKKADIKKAIVTFKDISVIDVTQTI